SRIVTITAPGGMGKTRLALELGARFADDLTANTAFRNGIVFVELAPLTSADNIPLAIAEAVDLPLAGRGISPIDQILNYFREKKLLLIMDNFEHVMDGAPIVAQIAQI